MALHAAVASDRARLPATRTRPTGWRPLLAAPDLHWRTGASAFELASAGYGRRTPPGRVRELLDSAGIAELAGLEIVIGLPERKTDLAAGGRGSQTDLVCLARRADGPLVVLGVEGKAEEPSGPRQGRPRHSR